ncbi:hypothetical protein IV203_037052 [Nitzschia inconspicua]|uniref:Uncharacterized protein n=1 Tax=Nitzschia inconspicua TaxID=303405 RepID=A0A9K3PY80_9STRA|nr:hypothetical protein IV203_037052 [Nitzschia inconspicua]
MTMALQIVSLCEASSSASTSSSSDIHTSLNKPQQLLLQHSSTSDLTADTQTMPSSSSCDSSSSTSSIDDSSLLGLDGKTRQLMEQHRQYCCHSQSSFIDRPSCLTSSSRRSHSSSSVSFGSVHIRDYERIPGDHPETSLGVPLSLGWAFRERHAVSVHQWEKQKMDKFLEDDTAIVLKPRKATGGCGGASGNVRRLGAMTRKRLLMDEFNVPLQEITQAERELSKFKKQLEKQRQSELNAVLDPTTTTQGDGELEGFDRNGKRGKKKHTKKKSLVNSLRKGVLNKLSLRTPSRHSLDCEFQVAVN